MATKYPSHLEFLEAETLEEVDFNFNRDGIDQRVQFSTHHVTPKHVGPPWRHVVVTYKEATRDRYYPKVAIARYRKLAGSWHCVALIKCHPGEVESLCEALRGARDALAEAGYAE